MRAILLLLVLWSASALAHPGHSPLEFADGLLHPLSGADHLAAMLAVGGWSALRDGQHRRLEEGASGAWVLVAFLAGMAAGGVAGLEGLEPPGLEAWVLTSSLLAATLLALVSYLPTWSKVLLASVFAAVHGMAHTAKISRAVDVWPFLAGFLIGSALLLFIGRAFVRRYVGQVRRFGAFLFVLAAVGGLGLTP